MDRELARVVKGLLQQAEQAPTVGRATALRQQATRLMEGSRPPRRVAKAKASGDPVAIFDQNGNLVGVCDPADITPLAEAEAALAERMAAMDAMLANIRHGIILWDKDHRVVASNPIAAELFRSLAEVKGQAQFLLYLADQIEDSLEQLANESDSCHGSFLCKVLGMYSTQLWRAIRLVVDTGIHRYRWTRERAIDYFMENGLLSRRDATKEVERYFNNPGQATSYMIGSLRILALRERARTALGNRFDIRDFHAVVLENGSLPLDLLEELVDSWIAAQRTN